MKVLLLLLVAALYVQNIFGATSQKPKDQYSIPPTREDFERFKAKYNKNYEDEAEETKRFKIFVESVIEIENMQQELQRLGHKGSMPSVTKFADMTRIEFEQKVLMPPANPAFDQPCSIEGGIPATPVSDLSTVGLPSSFDWRSKGAVTPVKDQGSAGTCWAFSTTGNIEGQWNISGHPLVSLSEEQLNDCDGYDCGVFGGWPCRAYQYVIQVGGLVTEEQYPYCVGSGSCYPCAAPGYNNTFCGDYTAYCNATQFPCEVSSGSNFAAKISGWKAFGTDETQLQAQLIANGPLSVLIDAGSGFPPLQYHEYGVYDPWSCDPTALDHAILLVGYGEDDGTPYWDLKNSWGTDWADDHGFFKMLRGSGTCGVNQAVTSSY